MANKGEIKIGDLINWSEDHKKGVAGWGCDPKQKNIKVIGVIPQNGIYNTDLIVLEKSIKVGFGEKINRVFAWCLTVIK